MDDVRKLIGLTIILLLGLPALFGAIWTVGVTTAVTSPGYISDLPRKIRYEIPVMADYLFVAASDPYTQIPDENARNWIHAAALAPTTPRDLIEEIGILEWLEYDLALALEDLARILQSRAPPTRLYLNLRPLKRAITHEAIDRYFLEVVENLPPCTERQLMEWQKIGVNHRKYSRRSSGRHELPACRPDDSTLAHVADQIRDRDPDMPDEVEIFDGRSIHFFGFNLFAAATLVSYLLLIIPVVFVGSGAFVAASFTFRFCKWAGGALFAGGLLTLGSALLPQLVLMFTPSLLPGIWMINDVQIFWSPALSELLTGKLCQMADMVVFPLLEPVLIISAVVSGLGLVMLGVGAVLGRRAGPPPFNHQSA